MTLSELSVRRGVTLSMLYLAALGFGLFSLGRLRLDMYPDIKFPIIGVVTQYDGAGPREIEDLVTRRIEGAVTAVENVKKVTSTSKHGVSIVLVQLNWGTDMEQAELDVRKYIDLSASFLPADAKDPIVFAFDPSMQPIVFLSLSGPYAEVKLREIAEEKVEPLIERLPGVAVADTVGGGKREILVHLDARRLGAAGISPQQVVTALRYDNVQLPGGSFTQGTWDFTIQTKGQFTRVPEIEQVVVGMRGQVPVRLRDVARVVDGLQETTRVVRNNGRPGILLMVRKQSDANSVLAVREVLKALPGIEHQAGRGVQLKPIFDQAEFIELAIGNLSGSAWQALVMTFLVLIFFLRNLRSSLIVTAAIPTSVVVAFSAMDAAGLTLNIISLAGLALAIGMLVDNSIVVLEAIFVLNERGLPPRQAAIEGAQEVGMAITASTLTTLVVFLPVLFVPGIAGQMFSDMAVTICVALTASLIVARTAIPFAASRLLKPKHLDPRAGIRGVVARLLDRLASRYARSLAWTLRRRKTTFVLTTLAFVVSCVLVVRLPTDFFPKMDQSLIILQAETAVGTDIAETDRVFQRIERLVRERFPEVTLTNADIGSGEGWIAMFAKGSHSGFLRLKLKPRKQRARTQMQIEDDLRKQVTAIPGVTASLVHGGFFGEGDIVVEIYGDDLAQAHGVGMKIKQLVQSVEGTADAVFSLEAGRPEYEVVLDRSRLAALGLSTGAVSSAISTVFAGSLASVYREKGYEYDIRVRGPRDYRVNDRALRSLPISTPTGVSVPLSSIARVGPAVGPAAITRRDQQRMVTVTCSVTSGNMGAVLAALNAKLERFPWPEGFSFRVGGQAEDFTESFKWLAIALLASILLVYMVMASQFESLLHPFLILFTIPLSVIGVVAGLGLTGTAITVTALIGGLILVGIVVNNGIVLVDAMNQYREKRGLELEQAVVEAAQRRLRPVLMTAGTTILGMVPLALELGEGSESWSPLARAVIGGLTTSTLLTLMVIPALYLSLETFRAKRRERRARRAAERQTTP